MKISTSKTRTNNLILKGSSFIFKFFYQKCGILLHLPRMYSIDTWEEDHSNKKIYVMKLRFKNSNSNV